MLRSIGPLLVLAFSAAASQQPGGTLPTTHTVPTRDYEQVAPYWTTEPGWHTDLQLRNNLASEPLTVNAAVRVADGSETALPPVTLLPGEVRSVSLMDALMAVHSGRSGQAGAYGSVVMRYHSKSMRNLYASVMVHVTGQPIMYHLDASSAAHNWHSGTEEGIWWLPKSTVRDYLILSNKADHAIHGTLELYDTSGKLVAQPFQLTTGGTQRLSVGGLVAQAGSIAKYGGIRVVMNEDAGFLDAAHILFDLKSGFSATMKMFPHNPALSRARMDFVGSGKWVTRAPMLALSQPDSLLALPGRAVLRPMFLVRNTTSKPLDVQADLHWRNQFQDGRFSLPVLHLAPQETRLVDVARLQQDGSIPLTAYWAQITLTTDAEPNDLMAVAASYDSTLRYGAQTPFSDQLANHLEGGEWKVDATHTSILAIGNGSNAPVDTMLSILFDQGRKKYQATHSVAANDQWFVDVGQLIRSAVPDDNGLVLPLDLASGAYSLRQLHGGAASSLYEGKVITDKTFGHATYGCMVCCGDTGDLGGVYLNPDPLLVALGAVGYDDPEGTNQCNGQPASLSHYVSSWSVDDPSIVTMSRNGQATGAGVGSTTITANLTNVPNGDGEDQPGNCPFLPLIYDPGDEQTAPTVTISPTGPTNLPIHLSETSPGATVSLTATGDPAGGSYSWTTANSNVSLSSTTAPTITVTGNTAGQTTATVTYTLNGVSSQPATETLYVQTPTTSVITSNIRTTYNNQTETSCDGLSNTPNAYGYQRCVLYQIQDQNTTNTAISGVYTVHEVITDIATNVGPNVLTGDNISNSAGVFRDQVGVLTSRALPANACAISSQTFTVSGATIRVNCLRYSATDVSITNITGAPNSCTGTCP